MLSIAPINCANWEYNFIFDDNIYVRSKLYPLIGFDGYSKKDPRNSEMNDVFENYFSLNASIPIVTLTPSIYNIKKNEIFNSYTS